MNPSTPFDAMMSFGKFVPGFDFLQGLVNNSDKAMPTMGQWVAPTLDPDELERRIKDLKAVHFWLEQNARMLATTIQALEVQKMTLRALGTMNVSVADLAEAMKLSPAEAPPPPPPPFVQPKPAEPKAAEPPAAAPSPAPTKAAATEKPAAGPGAAAATAVDPLQWWGALTEQFAQLAQAAVGDAALHGAPSAPARKPGTKAASPAKAKSQTGSKPTGKTVPQVASKRVSGARRP